MINDNWMYLKKKTYTKTLVIQVTSCFYGGKDCYLLPDCYFRHDNHGDDNSIAFEIQTCYSHVND